MKAIDIIKIAVAVVGLLVIYWMKLFPEGEGGKHRIREFLSGLGVVLLCSELLALLFTLFDPEWDGFFGVSIICTFVGGIGYSGIKLIQYLTRNRTLSFGVRQAVEALGLMFSAFFGLVVATSLNHFIFPGSSLLWHLSGFEGIFNALYILLVVSVSMTVAMVRLFYQYRLQNEEVQRQQQSLELLRTREEQVSARLQSIRARINPHFLYNALNAAIELVHTDPDRAEKMLSALSRFFQAALESGETRFGTVAREIDLVRTYLAIEEARFGSRLSYSIDVDASTLNEPMPHFLLQPLVENAVKHGINRKEAGGQVRLRVGKENGYLRVEVGDDGPDFPADLVGGYGWESVRNSLDLLYPDRHKIVLVNGTNKHMELWLEQTPA